MLHSYLWFNEKRDETEPLESVVARALVDYSEYYPGGMPDTCYINPQQGPEGEMQGVCLRHSNAISPQHFWMGVDILS